LTSGRVSSGTLAEIGKDIAKAKKLLEEGLLVGIPTETVYGLAGNALRADAVTRIFDTKNRPHFDPLIVHVAPHRPLDNLVARLPAQARQLADALWPGPLTLLLEKTPVIPSLVTSGLDAVAIRCPDHPLAQQLLAELDFPLAAPSANPFGYVSPTTAQHVEDQLGKSIPYILDGGPCKVGIESTIVGFDNGGHPVIHRLGGISLEKIEQIAGHARLQINHSSNPSAPGQLQSHYAPRKKLLLGDLDVLIAAHAEESVALLTFRNHYAAVAMDHQIMLSPTGNLEEAAQRLFDALRKLDQMPVDLILAEEVPQTGLGRAINDRLHRAASN